MLSIRFLGFLDFCDLLGKGMGDLDLGLTIYGIWDEAHFKHEMRDDPKSLNA